jgi:minor histocompatibility antigen H13
VTFVFASDVMMTVASSFESPMKILILNKGVGFSMIGIGDIIIPGLLVSMCIRIDFIRNLLIVSLQKK